MRDWRGVAAVVLASGIAISLVLAFVAGLIEDEPAPQWIAYLVFAALGGVIGVVGGYVKRPDEPDGNGR
jgi:hypothetical protein